MRRLAVDVATVADSDDQYDQLRVFDAVDHAAVTDSDAPEISTCHLLAA